MKKYLLLFVILLALASQTIFGQGERNYQRAIQLAEKGKFLKAANKAVKAYNKGFRPSFRPLSLTTILLTMDNDPEQARYYFTVAEDAAAYFHDYIRDRPENRSESAVLTGTMLYDSLFLLKSHLVEAGMFHTHYDPEILVRAGITMYDALEKYDSCMLYANIGIKHSGDPYFAITKGNIYIQEELPDSALVAYTIAMKKDPGNTKALIGMGEAYELKQEYKTARGFYDMAYAQDASNLYVLFCLAYLDMATFNYKKALEGFQSIIAQDPEYTTAYYMMGDIYFELEEYPKAIEAYKQYLEYMPGDKDALHNLKAAEFNLQQMLFE